MTPIGYRVQPIAALNGHFADDADHAHLRRAARLPLNFLPLASAVTWKTRSRKAVTAATRAMQQ